MLTKSIKLFFLLLLAVDLRLFATSPYTVLPCTVEFPKTVKNIPEICIYQSGERFNCELDREGKRACFTLPIDKACSIFYFVIARNLEYESEENTVQYLKVSKECSYKFYEMELVKAPRKRYRVFSEVKTENQEENEDRWIISEKELPSDRRIPDDAIIVLLNAEYVDDLKGENVFEFPTIIVRSDIINIAGSESEFQNRANELILSTIDYNSIHENPKIHTKKDKQRILVAMSGL